MVNSFEAETKLIFGPPGTGKTTYLLDVLEKELLEHDPDKIAFVSFTREGAYQGRDRAIEQFNYEEDDFPFFRTLHSIAFRYFKMRPSEMMNKSHYKILSDSLNMKIKGYYDYNLIENDDMYLFYIDLYRNNKTRAEQIVNSINTQTLSWVEKNYREMKKHFNIVDFTDLIIRYVKEGEPLPVKVAIIDEAQDLTSLQWEMIKLAFSKCERIYIAGDDDQAIYEWSGADVNYFINIGGEIKILEKSYRLPERIMEQAKSISKKISNRINKDFESTGREGSVIALNEIDELEINQDETYLFLSRNNMFLPKFQEHLMRKAVPFTYRNKPFIEPQHVTAINTYVRAQRGLDYTNRDFLTMKRLLNPNMKMNKETEWFDILNIPNDKMAYYRDILKNKTDIRKCNARINTIHSVKGAEADNVVLFLNVTRSVYNNIQVNPDSEHRVFYVGATRARKNLYILLPDHRYYYDII